MNHPLISGKAAVGAVAHGHPDPDDSASGTCALEVRRAVARVRFAEPCAPGRVAAALGRTAERWRQRNFEPRRDTIRKLATALEMAPELLDESLEALLEPLGRDRLYSLAANLPAAPRLFGFLMPGNVPGAGIHEVCAAMLAGAGVVIKAASAEPFFFAGFIGSLAEIDAAVAARVAVVSFGRGDASAMREVWASCDGGVVAYGDDATIAALEAGRGARPTSTLPLPQPPRRRLRGWRATSRCSSNAAVSRRITFSSWAARARRAALRRAWPARSSRQHDGWRRRGVCRSTLPLLSGRCASARAGARSRSARATMWRSGKATGWDGPCCSTAIATFAYHPASGPCT